MDPTVCGRHFPPTLSIASVTKVETGDLDEHHPLAVGLPRKAWLRLCPGLQESGKVHGLRRQRVSKPTQVTPSGRTCRVQIQIPKIRPRVSKMDRRPLSHSRPLDLFQTRKSTVFLTSRTSDERLTAASRSGGLYVPMVARFVSNCFHSWGMRPRDV